MVTNRRFDGDCFRSDDDDGPGRVDTQTHTSTNLTARSCYGPKQLLAGQGPAGEQAVAIAGSGEDMFCCREDLQVEQ